MSDPQQDARAIALSTNHVVRTVEFKGAKFDVRAPTLGASRRATRMATDPKTKETDAVRLMVLLVIACTYHHGSDDRVYQAADEDTLLDSPTVPGTMLHLVTSALREMSETPPEVVKTDF